MIESKCFFFFFKNFLCIALYFKKAVIQANTMAVIQCFSKGYNDLIYLLCRHVLNFQIVGSFQGCTE